MSDNQNRIFVNLRVRPRNEREKKSELLVNYDLQDPKVLNLSTGKTYGFDAVYYDSVTQKGIFNNSVKPVMKNIMSGYQSAILCYGQTGSGKTRMPTAVCLPVARLRSAVPCFSAFLTDKPPGAPGENRVPIRSYSLPTVISPLLLSVRFLRYYAREGPRSRPARYHSSCGPLHL